MLRVEQVPQVYTTSSIALKSMYEQKTTGFCCTLKLWSGRDLGTLAEAGKILEMLYMK